MQSNVTLLNIGVYCILTVSRPCQAVGHLVAVFEVKILSFNYDTSVKQVYFLNFFSCGFPVYLLSQKYAYLQSISTLSWKYVINRAFLQVNDRTKPLCCKVVEVISGTRKRSFQLFFLQHSFSYLHFQKLEYNVLKSTMKQNL